MSGPGGAADNAIRWLREALGARMLARSTLDRRRIHGDVNLAEADPVLTEHADVTYMPQSALLLTMDSRWGLFDRAGQPIESASYRRGPGPTRLIGGERAPDRFETLPRLDDVPYVYLGHFSAHYGHFLLTSLGRLWPLLRAALPPGRKFVYHAPEPPDAWFAMPFVAAILGALGLDRSDFVFLTEPVRLGRMLVPGPSFEESHLAHRAHRDLGLAIGAGLAGDEAPPARSNQPLYLSRTRLASGTHRVANEDALAEALAQAGVAIAHPEELALADQIRLLEAHDTVVSLVGSALHTALLARHPTRLVGISMQPTIHSDYRLVDLLVGNRSHYLFPTYVEQAADQDGFHRLTRFAQPRRVVDAVLRALDAR